MHLMGIAVRDRSRAPMRCVGEVEVTKESGIVEDSRGKPGKRQITVLSCLSWADVCEELEAHLPWTMRRANIFLDSPRFNESYVGKRIQIGDSVVLEITGETTPCKRMGEQHPGLEETLRPDWRGGVTCRVIEEGSIQVGDKVSFIEG